MDVASRNLTSDSTCNEKPIQLGAVDSWPVRPGIRSARHAVESVIGHAPASVTKVDTTVYTRKPELSPARVLSAFAFICRAIRPMLPSI